MSIKSSQDYDGIALASLVVAVTLRKMQSYAQPGMSTMELDAYGGQLLREFGAQSAPIATYKFPGWTCISVNGEIAHGIPRKEQILTEGDLINIDVSAEVEGYWSDNGGSFVLGKDSKGHRALVNASKDILHGALEKIKDKVRINKIGGYIETNAKKKGYQVIRNLAGHGVGRSLHESPHEILNYCDIFNRSRFKGDSVVAVETFISTDSTMAIQAEDGWTLVGNRGGFTAQHEHTIIVTDDKPIILTAANGF